MRKISFFILCVLILALAAVPAFASSVFSLTFFLEQGSYMALSESLIPPGNYNVIITYSGSEIVSDGSIEFVGTATYFESPDLSYTYLPFVFDLPIDGNTISISGNFGCIPQGDNTNLCIITFSPDIGAANISMQLTPIVTPAFEKCISDGLVYITQWAGSVIDSLVSGELAPLLVSFFVFISIPLLFFAVKLIKRISWGY